MSVTNGDYKALGFSDAIHGYEYNPPSVSYFDDRLYEEGFYEGECTIEDFGYEYDQYDFVS